MSRKKLEINNIKLDPIAERLIRLMDEKRGNQAKLSKSINKTAGYFSEIKRGNPVKALHIKAVGIVFGQAKVTEILGLNNIEENKHKNRISEEQKGFNEGPLKRLNKLEMEMKDLQNDIKKCKEDLEEIKNTLRVGIT